MSLLSTILWVQANNFLVVRTNALNSQSFKNVLEKFYKFLLIFGYLQNNQAKKNITISTLAQLIGAE